MSSARRQTDAAVVLWRAQNHPSVTKMGPWLFGPPSCQRPPLSSLCRGSRRLRLCLQKKTPSHGSQAAKHAQNMQLACPCNCNRNRNCAEGVSFLNVATPGTENMRNEIKMRPGAPEPQREIQRPPSRLCDRLLGEGPKQRLPANHLRDSTAHCRRAPPATVRAKYSTKNHTWGQRGPATPASGEAPRERPSPPDTERPFFSARRDRRKAN